MPGGEESEEVVDPVTSLSCVAMLDALYLCATPSNQFTHYRREGEVDDCKRALNDFTGCFKLKSMRDRTAAAELLRQSQLAKLKPSTTIGHIWEGKSKPAWN